MRKDVFLAQLEKWGRIVASAEAPNGYPSVTTLNRIGMSASSAGFVERADDIFFPHWVEKITSVVNPLPASRKWVLRVRYMMAIPERLRPARAGMSRKDYESTLEQAHADVWGAL